MQIPNQLWSGGDPAREPAPAAEEPETREWAPPPPPPSPRRRRRGPLVVTALAAAALAGGATFAVTGGTDAPQRADLPAATAAQPGLRESGNSVRDIYRAASPAVVSVRTGGGQGTGFLVDGEGTIVTNAHVVGDSGTVQIQFGDEGETVTGQVAGRDSSVDLAVVHVDPSAARDVEPLAIADSTTAQVGDEVVAIGNPFGLERTATAGIVSALDRQITAPNGFSIDEVIQTDAPINPGNSGGPLLNTRGQVVGVNSQIQSSGGGNVGIGFAVPSNTVRDVVPRLAQGETIERAWLGVSTGADAGGARIATVQPGSPAQQAGLQTGDVIASIDGTAVEDPDDVAAVLEDAEPGDVVSVDVGGRSVDVELGTRPANAR